jgi:hypothetical protein
MRQAPLPNTHQRLYPLAELFHADDEIVKGRHDARRA